MTGRPWLVAAGTALIAAGLALATGCTPANTGTSAPAAAGSAGASAANPSAANASAANGSVASASAAAANGAGSYRERLLAWGRQFSACARSHGYPTFPDPVYPANAGDQPLGAGPEIFSVDKAVLERVQEGACGELLAQRPPTPDQLQTPSPAKMAERRHFSQCMRQHGLAQWPDPKPDGTFPILGGPYSSLTPPFRNVPPDVDRAYNACFDMQTDWRMRAS